MTRLWLCALLAADLSSQISLLRRSGANVLMLFVLPKQTIAAFVAANRFGWRPPTYVASVSVDPAVMKIVRATTGTRRATTRSPCSG